MFEIIAHKKIKGDLKKLSKNEKTIFSKIIETKVRINPVRYGKPLHDSLKNHRSIRFGKYRVIYKITKKKVLISIVGLRKEVYEKARKRLGL
jgi:mRNA-degrading endonuclease RelE of RelBE toxin-antitoxin system